MNFTLRLGGQLAHLQALTPVSNWGEPVQPTTLQFEMRRVFSFNAVSVTQHLIDEVFPVS
jgi:hypothetical protein